MAVTWTLEQQEVIDTRARNLLVSAAAGSGKTAVLVERILSRIQDSLQPVDIDQLLVVTFTRAAAGEMKERIGRALQKRLEEDPGNEHLQRQQTLLHHAQISTIHGFCSFVIRNYFQRIDLDPVYRMADEGELQLMKTDVMEKLLEEAYASQNPKFEEFVECYAAGKGDGEISALILKLYEFSMSYPWPKEWLEACRRSYQVSDPEEIKQGVWAKEAMDETRKILKSVLEEICENRRIACSPGGPFLYDEALAEDQKQVEELLTLSDFDKMAEAFSSLSFARLSGKKMPDVDPERKAQIKEERDSCKKILTDLGNLFFQKNTGEIARDLAMAKGPVGVLITLTEAFLTRFEEKKRSKNVLDFGDLEHLTLSILLKKEDGKLVRTEAAKELSRQFSEIMVDEYQDSNYIQEAILSAVSREEEGQWNRFMVGDIKQSIYGFRLARPELFLEKYHSYSREKGEKQRIDLDRNFRSRPEVLETVNYVFRQLLCEDMGGIVYDDAASLHAGASYPDAENSGNNYRTEVLLISREDPDLEDDRTLKTRIETEAAAVAERIRKMVGKERVFDQETGTSRPVKYRDIVILLRTLSGWADIFLQVLTSAGIPAYTTSKTGYFSTVEVQTVLNYLRLLDNPEQEIPLTAVLYSPIVGCNDEELSLVRLADKKGNMFHACQIYAENGEREPLKRRLAAFLAQLSGFRLRVPYTPIHELITDILEETGYGSYAAAMPSGMQRRANLEMLVEKAVEFENGSYRGLFPFIRTMDQIQKYDVDFGEVNIYGESADTVRIMSIHKSKGLEFPVVFVSGTGKTFNQTDSRASLVLHSRLGIGVNAVNPEKRKKTSCLSRQVIQKIKANENLSEELRVLYVAMTRAKEKLILTGTVSKMEKKIKECAVRAGQTEEVLPYQKLSSSSCMLDWLLAVFSRNRCFLPLYEACGVVPERKGPFWEEDLPVEMELVRPGKLVEEEVLERLDRSLIEEKIRQLTERPSENTDLKNAVEERFCYHYPYEKEGSLPVKLSVSELKKAGMEQTETGKELFPEKPVVPLIPEFLKKGEAQVVTGADRGTAFHRFLECLDYRRAYSRKELCLQAEELVACGKMSPEQKKGIDYGKILNFTRSPIGLRMRKAFLKGTLKREQPFVFSVPASEVDDSYSPEESILVQGMMDAWFPEQDGLVIVDYKTDYVEGGDTRILTERYGLQLKYYREALERATGQRVKECILYSFSLNQEIPCPV